MKLDQGVNEVTPGVSEVRPGLTYVCRDQFLLLCFLFHRCNKQGFQATWQLGNDRPTAQFFHSLIHFLNVTCFNELHVWISYSLSVIQIH